MPRRELSEPIDGGFGLGDEPIDGLAGSVESEAVLYVVELNSGVCREADASVPRAFGGVDLAVAILPPGGTNYVASLDLHDFSSVAALHCSITLVALLSA